MGNVCSCCGGGSDKKEKKPDNSKQKFSELKQTDEANKNAQQQVDNDSKVPQEQMNNVTDDKTQHEQQEESGEEQEDDTQDDQSPNDSSKSTVIEFGGEGESQGEFKMAKGIAVFLYGDVAVTEHSLGRVYLFGKDGTYKHTVGSTQDDNQKAKLLYPTDVAFTPLGHIAVADQTRHVKIFNLDGDFLHRFNIKGDDEDEDVKPKAYSIDVTSDEQILVGDIRRKVITIIKEADASCEWIRKIKLNIEPHFIATNVTNGPHHALVCDWKAGEVNAIDIEVEDDVENVIFKLDTFEVDGKPGLPKGVACDNENRIYICVSRLDDSADKKNVYVGTGHIHQYSSVGEFQKCLTKGLFHPRGLTWHNGSLYVANSHSVVILNTS